MTTSLIVISKIIMLITTMMPLITLAVMSVLMMEALQPLRKMPRVFWRTPRITAIFIFTEWMNRVSF